MNVRILTTLLLITAGSVIPAAGQSFRAQEGVLDLRNLTSKDRFIVNLNGEWEFYWNQMLFPNDFKKRTKPKPDIYGDVPSYWTAYNKQIPTTGFGYATYHLKIILPDGINKRLAFEVPVFDSSFDLWINDSLIYSNGIPGRTAEATIPNYRPGFMRYTPAGDTLSLLINVSNFHHRRGGFWLPMRFGTFTQVQKEKAAKYAGSYATISLLLGFALFFLIFFILYPKDRIHGFFGIGLLGIAIRPLFTSEYLIYDFIDISWTWTIRLEYISLYFITGGLLWFTDRLYPSKFIRIIAYLFTPLFIAAFIFTLVFPVKYFSYATLVIYPALIILFGYSLLNSFILTFKKKKLEAVYLAAFILLAIGAFHDVLVSLGKSHTGIGYVMSVVVIGFIFMQAILLLYKWVYAYQEKEKLQVELEFMNRNLEEMIRNRTIELQIRTEEIEAQNSMIASKNKQLSETIQLKNKIFSVISHDLRSPVVNILYMLNLLKEKEYKEKYDTFANSSIEYAQMVINLLENMLVWGRGQEDKINYSPAERDLASIILTNLSIFKETADRKDISVNFTQKGNSIGYFDKDLMDIVIRNLLSNAVKYTRRGGRISILLKDKSKEEGVIMLKICDNGIGIPLPKQKDLFTITEIESTPGTENEKGTGLGLKLCYELVKINKGNISVESGESEGTCFIITLPHEKINGTQF
jgi:signal transduction histidine kinase